MKQTTIMFDVHIGLVTVCLVEGKKYVFFHFYTLPHDSGGVLWFHVGHPCVSSSVSHTFVRPSVCQMLSA